MTPVIRDDWLTRPATQAVMSVLSEAGFDAYVVGGCVRNALLGVPVSDVDIATKHPEFSHWKWIEPTALPDLIVPFKRDVYVAVLKAFDAHL